MENIKVNTSVGERVEVVYNIDDFPYDKFRKVKTCKKREFKKDGVKKEITYLNLACAFDIESTTIESKGYKKWLKNGKTGVLDDHDRPFGFMYQWQACIENDVVFGRTWEEFIQYLDTLRDVLDLSNSRRLVIYVHNLAYEWQFMKEFIQVDGIFAKEERKPMYVLSDGIEFRCSYMLSNMSLAKFCENTIGCMYYKKQDTYDYRIIRTPDTELSKEEKDYCYCDVRGLCECINAKLKEDTLATIPLTNTGYVRREYRKAMKENKDNHRRFQDQALTPELYTMFKRAFRGGNTHASRFMSGKILEEVYSFDISSSYPSCIMMDYFPMTKFTKVTIDSLEKLAWYNENYCCIYDVEFLNINLKPEHVIPYIDIAHCYEKHEYVNDNGRVLSAKYVKMTITNIDLDIIMNTYTFDNMAITNAHVSKKGKLPIELRTKMMDFYNAKTQLKGVDGKEYEYMKSKNMLNSTFGMMVTAIDHDELEYNADNMEWNTNNCVLEETLESFYKSRNNFLSYQWGVFVTANARKRLQIMLDKVGCDVVYIDTDSIKFVDAIHIKEFEKMNEELISQATKNDIQAIAYQNGKPYPLGVWDNDGAYIRFKTLGAKKYCYDSKEKDGSIGFHITVSGMGKKAGAKQVAKIENFLIGKTFSNVGRTVSYYHDTKPHQVTINGCTFTTASNIGIVDTTYTLGVTTEYWELIKDNVVDVSDILYQ